jgi:hypothetical protein
LKNYRKITTAIADMRLVKIWIVLAILASISAVYALPPAKVQMRSTGLIKALGVGVYWDNGCTNVVSSIDWGLLEPGSVKTVTVYVRNEGNAPIVLSLQTENWNPDGASSYMSLGWNYGGQQIDVNAVLPVTLSLSISPSIQGITSFSFTIIISATG